MPLLTQWIPFCQAQPQPSRGARSTLAWLALIVALVGIAAFAAPVHAQAPRGLRIPPVILPDHESTDAELEALDALPDASVGAASLRNVIVDTDPGVDDAAAILWLFSQSDYPVDVLGLVTVAGAGTIDNTTNNALVLRNVLGLTASDFVVVQGAGEPLERALSLTGLSIHGPDALWFLGLENFTYPNGLDPRTATDFYCETLVPGTLVVALGPLTNLATAIQSCPLAWNDVEIVSLGGAKYGGNQTPVAEYNYWQDPEAAQIVLGNTITNVADVTVSYSVNMVLYDAFKQFEFERNNLAQLPGRGAFAFLWPALQLHWAALQLDPPILPDPVAMMVALDPSLALAQPALVKVLGRAQLEEDEATAPSLARGQTIIGLSVAERVAMIATNAEFDQLSVLSLDLTLAYFTPDPADEGPLEAQLNLLLLDLLGREVDNANVIVDIDGRRMVRDFVQAVRKNKGMAAQGEELDTDTAGMESGVMKHDLFVPLVVD